MKFTVLTALMAIALPAPAFASDWVSTSSPISGDKYYIDRQSIRTMPNSYKRAWSRSDLAKADKDGDTRYTTYYEYDCIEKRYRLLSYITSKGGQVTNTGSKVSQWEYVAPDTIAEDFFQFICRK
jgi:hypothetical protein